MKVTSSWASGTAPSAEIVVAFTDGVTDSDDWLATVRSRPAVSEAPDWTVTDVLSLTVAVTEA